MKRGILIISFSLLFTCQNFLHGQQLVFKTYSVQDGLVTNTVRRIFQDSKGFLWFMTWEGLSKYDGQRFTNFSTANGLSFNLVNDVYETPDHKLIVAENNGAIDVIEHDAVVKRSAGNIIINRFFRRKGKVIASTDNKGLVEISGDRIVEVKQTFPNVDYGDLVLWNDSLLVSGLSSGLRILDLNYNCLAQLDFTHLIYAVFVDSKKKCWIATSTGLKILSPPAPGSRSGYRIESATPGIAILDKADIRGITEDASGNLLISTVEGFVILQPDGRWQLFSEKDGLPSNITFCVFRDKEDNIWIGTYLGIAKLVAKNKFKVYTSRQGLLSNNIIDLISVGNEKVIVLANGHVQLFNKKEGNFSIIKTTGNTNYNGHVRNAQHPLLYSSFNKVIGQYIEQDNMIRTTYSRPMYEGVIDKEGHIFIATYEGNYVTIGTRDHYVSEMRLRTNNLLYDRNGYLWVGTWVDGLYRLRFTFTADSFTCIRENMSYLINGKEVRSLFEDREGNIWVGTRYNGIYRLSMATNKTFSSMGWNQSTGLMTDWIKYIAEDLSGNIWLGTPLGVDKLVRLDSGFRVFNFSRINNFYPDINAILPEKNNTILLATGSGLVMINDEQMENMTAVPVYLTSILLGAGKDKIQWHQQDQKASLKYRQNQAQFEFASPAFINEKQVLYSYRLQGSEDTNWSVPANTNSISYASLQAGRYRFEVKSLGWDGKYGEVSAFNFTIKPPYWKTGWFISLIMLLIALGIYGIYRYRINQLIKLQKVRNRIATDLHDEIGSALTNISLLSELTNNNIERPEQARTFVNRISEEVNISSQALDDIVWSINPGNDSLEQIVARMRRYAAEVFDAANITYSLELDEQFASRKLSMEQRRDVFLISKEAVNNIYKHAGAKTVEMKLGVQNHELYFSIRDDGKGFDTNAVNSRNGINNMKLRTAKWKGRVELHSGHGEGTSASFYLPLEKASLK